MKFFGDNHYLNWGITGFSVAVASMLFYFGIFHMEILFDGIRVVAQIVMPLIYGAVIAYLLNPVLNFLEKKVIYPLFAARNRKVRRRGRRVIRYACVLLCVFILCWLVYALLMTILPEIINSTVNIINNFPQYTDDIQQWVTKRLEDNPQLNALVVDVFDRYASEFEKYLSRDILPQLQGALVHLSSGMLDVLVFLKNIVIGLIVSVYILADKEAFTAKVKMFLYAFFSTHWADRILENVRFFRRVHQREDRGLADHRPAVLPWDEHHRHTVQHFGQCGGGRDKHHPFFRAVPGRCPLRVFDLAGQSHAVPVFHHLYPSPAAI